jgi:hypothetical protein
VGFFLERRETGLAATAFERGLLTPADNPNKRWFILQKIRDGITADNTRNLLNLYHSVLASGNASADLPERAATLVSRLYDLAYGYWKPESTETVGEKLARRISVMQKTGFAKRLAEAIYKRQLELFPEKSDRIEKSYRKVGEEGVE